MQSTSVTPPPLSRYWYPIPNHFLHFDPKLNKKSNYLSLPNNQIHSQNISSLTLHTTSNCSKQNQRKLKGDNNLTDQDPHPQNRLFSPTHSNQYPDPQKQEQEDDKDKNFRVIFTNMWWADLNAALGQRINVEGIVCFSVVFIKNRRLALPHVSVPDIRYIDWAELQRRGFKGVVFDKDNTITAPYSLTLWAPLTSTIEQCKAVFGHDIAVFSNSAGLYEYDHDGSKARTLEGKIGIKVLRHRVKKPAGSAEEIEKHFGCKSTQLIMVGDRPFTDIVYGNRNGFLTILTEPLSLAEEPFIVRQVRKLEMSFVNRWFKRGLEPIGHRLLPDALQCVKDTPSSLKKPQRKLRTVLDQPSRASFLAGFTLPHLGCESRNSEIANHLGND